MRPATVWLAASGCCTLGFSGVEDRAISPGIDRQLIPVDDSNCEPQETTGAAIPFPPDQSVCVTVFTPSTPAARVKRLEMSMTTLLLFPCLLYTSPSPRDS